MKRQVVGLLGFLLFLFCVLVVAWQLYQGTKKYLDKPVASTIYSQEIELPVITICHVNNALKFGPTSLHGVTNRKFVSGQFMNEYTENKTAENLLSQATEHYHYLLDYTGLYII